MAFSLQPLPFCMTRDLIVVGLFLAGSLAGCSKRDTPASSSPPTAERHETSPAQPQASTDAAIDACKLLSNEEIAAVQGQAPTRTQLVGESDGQLSVSQCNFLLPTGTNSISLRVVQRADGPHAKDPKQVWQDTFHGNRAQPADKRHARPLQKVDGVGEEAFWVGNLKTGGLHVLKGKRYIKISVGGEDDLQTKITKCSKLSQFVLPRLTPAD
jgi:hypothetical protein